MTYDARSNPFPGLRPFESNEEHLFFGRDGQSDELLRRLRRSRFLAVLGTSGSGKSSVVLAGLMPLLRRQHSAARTVPLRTVPPSTVPPSTVWPTHIASRRSLPAV